ncbi:response regulator [Gemmata sp. G18]|uniref:Response regulator n=1 Tax=Gemmata palustris TaxID=2822762 RepID=A0ABS5BQE9_9BACT|nr:response regulator [Gemmata palustris]MBP3955093.1 response regulator [Gemmata palustris]
MLDVPARALSVLHAEDNADHAELVRRCLQNHPAVEQLVSVEDGEAALDYVFGRGRFASAPPPDVILLDLQLPKADGLEVLGALKSHPDYSLIPVVILSTSTRETDVRAAYRLHANSYLAKPADFPSLNQLLRDFANYWGCRNSAPARGARP